MASDNPVILKVATDRKHGVDFGSFKFDIHNATVCVAAPRHVAR